MELEGVRIRGYRDPTVLGRGASSVVFGAVQESTGAPRALKVLLNEDLRARFERERDALSRLQHPAIVGIIDAGTADTGELYLVMERWDGSLKDRLAVGRNAAGDPAFATDEVIDIGLTLAEALQVAHGVGWLHRDIKPANVLYRGDKVALADFGIARGVESLDESTSLDQITPYHAAPETLEAETRAETATVSSDTYSLVSTLYTLLQGRPPFAARGSQRDTFLAFMGRVANDPPPRIARADVGPGWRALFDRGLAKDPSARFRDPVELAAALRALRDGGAPASAPPPAGTAEVRDLDATDGWGPGRTAPASALTGSGPTAGPPGVAPTGDLGLDPVDALEATSHHGQHPGQIPDGPSAPDRRDHRRLWIGAGITAAVVVVLLAAAFLLTEPADPDPPSTAASDDGGPSTTEVADGPVDDVDLAATEVVIDDSVDPPVVRWRDPTAGQYPFVVISDGDEGTPFPTDAAAGATSVEVSEMLPGSAWCAMVMTILDSTGARAESEWACVNGALPPDPSG